MMMKLFSIIFIIIFFTPVFSLTVTDVISHCSGGHLCAQYDQKLKTLKKDYEDQKLIREAIRALLVEDNIKHFSYEIYDKKGKIIIETILELNPIINEIKFEHTLDIDLLSSKGSLPIKEDMPFTDDVLKFSVSRIENYLTERGFVDFDVTYKIIPGHDDVDVIFVVKNQKHIYLDSITVDCVDNEIKRYVKEKLGTMIGEPFNSVQLKLRIDEINEYLVASGLYFTNIDVSDVKNIDKYHVSLKVKLDLDSKYVFTFSGHASNLFTTQELRQNIIDVLKKGHKNISINLLKKRIVDLYESRGFFDVDVSVDLLVNKYLGQVDVKQYHFTIKNEGHRIRVKEINFYGINFFTKNDLLDLYKKNGTDLSVRSFYDSDYIKDFSKIIKNHYIQSGLVFVEVSGPFIKFSKNNDYAFVEYKIIEKNQVTIDQINIKGVDFDQIDILKNIITNKKDGPFNAILFSDDIRLILNYLKSRGHYYVEIGNENSKNFVEYDNDYRKVTINIDLIPGNEIHVGKITVTGNSKTKTHVIFRESLPQEGDLVTPELIENIKSKLSSLGLFNKINIVLVPSDSHNDIANIIISVEERDFGTIELAPGFRNDLGLKLSGSISYNNLMGLNRGASLKGEVNQRLAGNGTLQGAQASRKIFEYSVTTAYQEPYFFSYPFAFQNSVTYSKKLYPTFLTSILSENASFSKRFSKIFASSISYQLDSINILEANNNQDVGYRRIGSMIPSVSFDWRDSIKNPRKGFYWEMTYQLAAPYFYSQYDENKQIYFDKLVSRQALYLPYSEGTVVCTLFVARQTNYAKVGSIPPLSIIRLSGIDNVRGYSDNEINTLLVKRGGYYLEDDIINKQVQGNAYFVNIKLEPRYYLDDEVILAPFLDAGRVYLDRLSVFPLRFSVGLALKYLTPMGTLELSYGVKLKRLQYLNGRYESPGNLAISIGMF